MVPARFEVRAKTCVVCTPLGQIGTRTAIHFVGIRGSEVVAQRCSGVTGWSRGGGGGDTVDVSITRRGSRRLLLGYGNPTKKSN